MNSIPPEDEAAVRAVAMQDYEDSRSEVLERLRFQVEYSQAALKNLHLVNGGAIIAILTFLGNTGVKFDFCSMRWAIGFFGLGLVFSLSAYFGAYFSQAYFMNHTFKVRWNAQLRAFGKTANYDTTREFQIGNRYLYGAIGASVMSLISFGLGAFMALSGLK